MANVLLVQILWAEVELCLVPRTNAVFYLELNSWGFRSCRLPGSSLDQYDLLNFKSLFDVVGLLKIIFPYFSECQH
jgi:hypothetical protein